MAKVSKYQPNVSGVPIQAINNIQGKTLSQISNKKAFQLQLFQIGLLMKEKPKMNQKQCQSKKLVHHKNLSYNKTNNIYNKEIKLWNLIG